MPQLPHFNQIQFKIQQMSKEAQKDDENAMKLARTLCIIFIVFVACWGPYTCLSVFTFLYYHLLKPDVIFANKRIS